MVTHLCYWLRLFTCGTELWSLTCDTGYGRSLVILVIITHLCYWLWSFTCDTELWSLTCDTGYGRSLVILVMVTHLCYWLWSFICDTGLWSLTCATSYGRALVIMGRDLSLVILVQVIRFTRHSHWEKTMASVKADLHMFYTNHRR